MSVVDSVAPATIADTASALRRGEVTSTELVQRSIAIAKATESVGSFIARFDEQALAAATAADAAFAAGSDLGPLHGIPLGIKDIIATRDAPTTAQSQAHDPAWSNGTDAAAVRRLRDAGAIITGTTTTMEFALGLPDFSAGFPIPRNPWNLERWAGGSSSGSASAIATGAVLGALGSDTGGSIRIPAAYCGITGLMPTYGRVPKSGTVPMAYTLDRVGPMARSARDCALLLSALAGADDSDVTTIDEPVPDYPTGLTGDITGLRIGYSSLHAYAWGIADPAFSSVFEAALGQLRSLGAVLVEIDLPLYLEVITANLIIMQVEALTYHLPTLRARWDDFGIKARSMLLGAIAFTSADYVQAQRVRRVGQRALAGLFTDLDLIATPTAAVGATPMSLMEQMGRGDVRAGGPVHTLYWDAVGNPVISLPIGFTDDGLPLAMQLAGQAFDEAGVLRAGDAYQRVTNWHLRVPPLVLGHDTAPIEAERFGNA